MQETDIESMAADRVDRLDKSTLHILYSEDYHEAGSVFTCGLVFFSGKDCIACDFCAAVPLEDLYDAEISFVEQIHDMRNFAASAALKRKYANVAFAGLDRLISLVIVVIVNF